MENFNITTDDNYVINGYKWLPKHKPRAVIQIAHGMAEHSMRYSEFASYLVKQGYAVYANDHRGHGPLANERNELGFFAEKDGWELVINDMLKVNGLIACDYPDTPIVLFGHSMGSFLARTFLIDYSNLIDGLILTGTGGDPGLMGKIGTLIAKLEKSMKGPKAPSHLLSKLTFGNFNKKIKSTRTKYDWLSTDEESVNKYINDSLCGQVCTTSFYFEMFQGMGALFEKEKKGYIPTHIPILILSGKHDPLGKNGKVLIELYNHYKRANIENVSYRIYQSARHEILNEKNKLEVFSNISSWLEINIQTFSKI